MDSIVDFYFKVGVIQAECIKVCDDKDLLDDFIQEITLILLEKESTFLLDLHKKGQLLYFIRKVITNQYRSETSPFYKKYKKYNNITDNIDDYAYRLDGQETFSD